MQFILTTDWEDGTADLTHRLVQELNNGKNVLWLVSGGSNIRASVTVMDHISEELSRQLTVLLADERYGDVGHPDSNWTQLIAAGFDPKYAQMLPVLEAGLSLGKTALHYEKLVNWAYADADVIVAQLGIGSDGHIAGILPHSLASSELQKPVIAYKGADFERLTLTIPALQATSVIFAFAFGETKHQALTTLQSTELTLAEQPAQLLKQVPEAYIYNDQIGE
jgi:6-phosphogluconolactonase/glucosamine-6-phosphate isomerase/deaminase